MLTIGNDPPQAPAMNDFPSRWRYVETLWNLGGVTLVRLCPPPQVQVGVLYSDKTSLWQELFCIF